MATLTIRSLFTYYAITNVLLASRYLIDIGSKITDNGA